VERNAYYRLQPIVGFDGVFTELAYFRNSTRWLFAGGDTVDSANQTTELSYVLANTDPNQTANVTLTYYQNDGTTTTKNVTIAPNFRVVVPAANANLGGLGTNKNFVAVRIDSDVAIVAERIVYWRYNGYWIGGNASFGYIPPGY
jgi:hypothetical protein